MEDFGILWIWRLPGSNRFFFCSMGWVWGLKSDSNGSPVRYRTSCGSCTALGNHTKWQWQSIIIDRAYSSAVSLPCIWCTCTACKEQADGRGYIGNINTTVTGKQCQQWSSDTPHTPSYVCTDEAFPDGSRAAAENYCRNPDRTAGGPWCYTMDPSTRWEYCDIPDCGTSPAAARTFACVHNFWVYSWNLTRPSLTRPECCGSNWILFVTCRSDQWRREEGQKGGIRPRRHFSGGDISRKIKKNRPVYGHLNALQLSISVHGGILWSLKCTVGTEFVFGRDSVPYALWGAPHTL